MKQVAPGYLLKLKNYYFEILKGKEKRNYKLFGLDKKLGNAQK
tara:strand:+ start:804 stop:932 length:129 start_codon:yes stop_codon:yes gene_type:complete